MYFVHSRKTHTSELEILELNSIELFTMVENLAVCNTVLSTVIDNYSNRFKLKFYLILVIL